MVLPVAAEYAYYCESRATIPRAPEDMDGSRLQLMHRAINLGYLSDLACWSQIIIRNQSPTARIVYLEHAFPQVDEMELFHSTGQTAWNSLGLVGTDIRTAEWPVHYRLPTYELRLEPGLNILRIYQKSRDLTALDWTLWDHKEFRRAVDRENFLFGGFFAICMALSFYNLVIFGVSRDRSHLYYFLYLSTYGWVQMFITGFTKLHVMPDSSTMVGNIGLVSVSSGIFFVYVFVHEIIEIRTFPRWMRTLYWTLSWGSVSNVLLVLAGAPFAITSQICLSTSAIGTIIGLIYAIYALRIRVQLAPIFLIAWSTLLLGTFLQVLAMTGFIENNAITRSANFIGATVEAILISYALAFKMKKERFEEIERRKHAFSQLEKMVYPHQLNLMKEGRQLEETMPLATGQACVICVDMVDSSKQNGPELKNLLRSFFDECHAIMNRGYLETGMQAYGFRIKEMGDGFLCSIGFPFASPPQLSIRELALDMAYDFIEKFEQVIQTHPISSRIDPLLSIGIAEGPIEGFFTLSGIRSYELFGKGIVLATRYEALRKFHRIPGEGHLICLKTSVLAALPASYQKRFTPIRLDKSGIRDDENAQDFHYERVTSSFRQARSA